MKSARNNSLKSKRRKQLPPQPQLRTPFLSLKKRNLKRSRNITNKLRLKLLSKKRIPQVHKMITLLLK